MSKRRLRIIVNGHFTAEYECTPEEFPEILYRLHKRFEGRTIEIATENEELESEETLPSTEDIARYLFSLEGDKRHTFDDIAIHFLGRKVRWMDDDYDKLYRRLRRAHRKVEKALGGKFYSEALKTNKRKGWIRIYVFKREAPQLEAGGDETPEPDAGAPPGGAVV